MKSVELGGKSPCACGSGKIYFKCCKSPSAKYVSQKDGTFTKVVTLSKEAKVAVREAAEQFKSVFGRKPENGDRILLLGFRSSPGDTKREFRKLAEMSNFSSHLVYAHEKTGLLVSTETYDRLSPRDRAEWDEAVQEYIDAETDGIDLLDPPPSDLQASVSATKFVIDDATTHMGSYLARSPDNTSEDWTLFVQYLLLVKCFWYTKCLSDRWDIISRSETAALARGIYECALLIGRTIVEPEFSKTLEAQALAGLESHPFRKKKDGTFDHSKIVCLETGEIFPAKSSFWESSSKLGGHHCDFFEKLYPLLSNQIHFDTRNMISEYVSTGTFLMWDDGDQNSTAILSLIVTLYTVMVAINIPNIPAIVMRDMAFLGQRMADAMDDLLTALSKEGLSNPSLEDAVDALFKIEFLSQR